MEESPFHAFLSLVHFDQETNKLRAHVQKVQQEIKHIDHEKHLLDQKLIVVKQEWQNARKSVDEHELTMKALEDERVRKMALLEQVASGKEQQALRKEIDTIKQKQHIIEQQLINVWNTLDTSKKAYEACNKSLEPEHVKFDAQHAKEEARAYELINLIQSRETERETKIKGLPHEWLEKYAMMRMVVEDPVVPVLQDSCSSCYSHLSKQELSDLRRNVLLQCKGCFRFLYIQS
jgi:predicted  nucleic acid-binding Zn-ribbon protein